MKRIFLVVVSLLLVLFSASCVQIVSVDISFDLAAVDAWDADLVLVAPGRSTSESALVINQALNELRDEITRKGGEATVEQQRIDENNNTPYKLSIRSATPEMINEGIFSYDVFTVQEVNGKRQVEFEMPASSLGVDDLTVTLRGKEILSHNGEKINNSTVRWTNPRGTLRAVVVEGRPVSWLGWLLLIGGIGMVGAAGVLWKNGKITIPNFAHQPAFRPAPPAAAQDIFWNDARPAYPPAVDREPTLRDAAPAAVPRHMPPPPHPYAQQADPLPTVPPAAPIPASAEPPAVMFCPNCGKPLPRAGRFCPGCGSQIIYPSNTH